MPKHGSAYLMVFTGPQGNSVTGPQGSTGSTGARGATGATGATGPQGSADTNAQVLAKIKAVDGSGSGLDADLLDGQQGSYYMPASTSTIQQANFISGSAFSTSAAPDGVLEYAQASSITDTKVAPSTDWYNSIRMGHGDPYSYYSNTLAIRMTGSDVGTIYTQTISNNNAQGWNKHWHNNNDGSGSGLDADLLDGQQGSSYLLKSGGTLTGGLTGTSGTFSGTVDVNQLNLRDMGDYITFYGGGETTHSISSRNNIGTAADDLRINSYGAVYINLDSNNNNSSAANFMIGRHGGASGTISSLFTVNGETGVVTWPSGSSTNANTAYGWGNHASAGYTNDQTAAEIRTKIASSPLTATHLAAGSVGASEIGNDVVNSQHYANGSIDRAHLAADVIDSTKLANDSVNSEHYVSNSIDALHLNVSGNGTTSQWLRSDGDGTMSWVTPPTNTGPTGAAGAKGNTGNTGAKGNTGAAGAAGLLPYPYTTTGNIFVSYGNGNRGAPSGAGWYMVQAGGAYFKYNGEFTSGYLGVGLPYLIYWDSSHWIRTFQYQNAYLHWAKCT